MAIGPRIRRKETRVPHPAAVRLLDTVIEMLDTVPIDELTMVAVLQRSGVSQGSLYHHFEDFPDLVEQAVVRRFEAGLNDSLTTLAGLLECADGAEFRMRFEELIRRFHAQERRPYRMTRLNVLGSLEGRPRLAERIGRAEQRANDEQTGYFVEFQRRGWMRGDLDAEAMSTFVAAAFLGRTVDDIVERPVDPQDWIDLAVVALRAVLFAD